MRCSLARDFFCAIGCFREAFNWAAAHVDFGRRCAAHQDTELTLVRHFEGSSTLCVACVGLIDLRAQAALLNLLRSDTPTQHDSTPGPVPKVLIAAFPFANVPFPMEKEQPLWHRIYFDPIYTAVAREIGYAGCLYRDLADKIEETALRTMLLEIIQNRVTLFAVFHEKLASEHELCRW